MKSRVLPRKGKSVEARVREKTDDLQRRYNAAHASLRQMNKFSGELLEKIKKLEQEILARDLLIAELKKLSFPAKP